jgi:hypothetical protein
MDTVDAQRTNLANRNSDLVSLALTYIRFLLIRRIDAYKECEIAR